MKNKIISVYILASLSFMGMVNVFAVSSININQASPTCVNLVSNNLYYGSTDNITGGEVTKLQNFLKLNSYLSSSATGYFGLGTYNAVRQFQKANNIQITGFVGPLTKAKIKEKSCYNQGSSVGSGNTNTNININTSNPNIIGGGSSSNGPNYWRPGGVMCTMEARLCPDGSMMPRNAACQWLPHLCGNGTTTGLRLSSQMSSLQASLILDADSQTATRTAGIVGGVACTMEARMCPDGSLMPRDNRTCAWLPNLCGSNTSNPAQISPNTLQPRINQAPTPVSNIVPTGSSVCAYGSQNCGDVIIDGEINPLNTVNPSIR